MGLGARGASFQNMRVGCPVFRWAVLLGAQAFVSSAFAGEAAQKFVTIGAFSEQGKAVQGHGRLLAETLEYELSRKKAFKVIADKRTQSIINQRIKDTNREMIDEKYWIDVGQAAGASHLLVGNVYRTRSACMARVRLFNLKTRAEERLSRPTAYNCTERGLSHVATFFARYLAGEAQSPASAARVPARRSDRKRRSPFDVTISSGGKVYIGGVEHMYDDDAGRYEPSPRAERRPVELTLPKLPAHIPPFEPPKEPEKTVSAAPLAPVVDLSRWPGFQPAFHEDGSPMFTAYDLATKLNERAELVAGLLMLIPLGFIFISAIGVRIHRNFAVRTMQLGLSLSVLALCLHLCVIGFYRYGLERDIMEDVQIFLLAAPFAAILVWLIGGRMVVKFSDMQLLRRIFSVILYTAYFAVVVLIASQVKMPVLGLGVATFIFWVVIRFANQKRKKRKDVQRSPAALRLSP